MGRSMLRRRTAATVALLGLIVAVNVLVSRLSRPIDRRRSQS